MNLQKKVDDLLRTNPDAGRATGASPPLPSPNLGRVHLPVVTGHAHESAHDQSDSPPRSLVPHVGIRHLVVEKSLLDRLVRADDAARAKLASRLQGVLDRSAVEWPAAAVLVARADASAYAEVRSAVPTLASATWLDVTQTFHLESVAGIAKRSQLAVFGAVAMAMGNETLSTVISRLVAKEGSDCDDTKTWLESLLDHGGRTLALAAHDFDSKNEFENESDAIVCAGFPKLHLVVGCAFRCSYCYLLSDEAMFRTPAFTRAYLNVEDAIRALEKAEKRAKALGHRLRFNTGELTDSLAIEPVLQLLPPIFEALRTLPRIELALVSKSGNPCPPVPAEVRGRIFHYASVSCEPQFEGKTATPEQRLDALGVSLSNGAITAVRLDPLGPAVLESVDDLAALQPIVAHMLEVARPDLLILGTPRFARRLLDVPHRAISAYVGRVEQAIGMGTEDWATCGPKVRPPEPLRVEAYRAVMDLVQAEAERLGVSCPRFWVCKETPAVLATLGLPPSGCCYQPDATIDQPETPPVNQAVRAMPLQRPGRSRQDYETPRAFLDAVESAFGSMVFDLAAAARNAVTPHYYSIEAGTDSLAQDWTQLTGNLWVNPPFGDIEPWAEKSALSAPYGQNDRRIFLLVPASIGSRWFAEHVHEKALVVALQPRLKFSGSTSAFPADCILAVYGESPGFEVWWWEPPRVRLSSARERAK